MNERLDGEYGCTATPLDVVPVRDDEGRRRRAGQIPSFTAKASVTAPDGSTRDYDVPYKATAK